MIRLARGFERLVWVRGLPSIRVCAALLFSPSLAGALFAQQHNYSPADVENGARIYNANCFACHGQNGDLVAGVDLRRGVFRHVSTDEDLAKVVVNGIPGTAMPPNRLAPQEVQGVVAYLLSMRGSMRDSRPGSVPLGDPRRGQMLVEGKGACLTCHRINGKGSHIAPDLSEGGMAIHVAGKLPREVVANLRFTLPDSHTSLELRGNIAWANSSGMAGIRFVEVPQSSQYQLEKWLTDRIQAELPSQLQPHLKAD